jgi:hypothetical protein
MRCHQGMKRGWNREISNDVSALPNGRTDGWPWKTKKVFFLDSVLRATVVRSRTHNLLPRCPCEEKQFNKSASNLLYLSFTLTHKGDTL